MNKRIRKKWLKKRGKYIDPKECWNLDRTIAEFVIPRLKVFKRDSDCYPDYGDVDSSEKWMEILDKMILGFEYILENDTWWINDPRYKNFAFDNEANKRYNEECVRRQKIIKEGLELFAEYFNALWW